MEQAKFIKELPGQWLRNLYKQFGYQYIEEVKHQFDRGFFCLRRASLHGQCKSKKYI
jgi:hypothetical protein